MNLDIASLRERESLLEANILQEKKNLQNARLQLDEAKRIYQSKIRASEKFVQFIEIQKESERIEKERIEEQELESFSKPIQSAFT